MNGDAVRTVDADHVVVDAEFVVTRVINTSRLCPTDVVIVDDISVGDPGLYKDRRRSGIQNDVLLGLRAIGNPNSNVAWSIRTGTVDDDSSDLGRADTIALDTS